VCFSTFSVLDIEKCKLIDQVCVAQCLQALPELSYEISTNHLGKITTVVTLAIFYPNHSVSMVHLHRCFPSSVVTGAECTPQHKIFKNDNAAGNCFLSARHVVLTDDEPSGQTVVSQKPCVFCGCIQISPSCACNQLSARPEWGHIHGCAYRSQVGIAASWLILRFRSRQSPTPRGQGKMSELPRPRLPTSQNDLIISPLMP